MLLFSKRSTYFVQNFKINLFSKHIKMVRMTGIKLKPALQNASNRNE